MISIIIPVYREQETIKSAVHAISLLDDQELLTEILIVQIPGEEYDIPTLVSPDKGRAPQMNFGAKTASGRIFLFLHADTRLPGNALSKIAEHKTGAFSLQFDSDRLPYRMLSFLTTWRSSIFRIPYGDQAIFVERDRFFQNGGFPNVPILEDVMLAQKIRPRVIADCVTTSTRRYEEGGLLRTVFNHRLLMLAHAAGVRPERLVRWRRGA